LKDCKHQPVGGEIQAQPTELGAAMLEYGPVVRAIEKNQAQAHKAIKE
jgi:hypothetical protein